MKKILLIQTFFLCYYLSVAQSNGSALPKGTYYKDGKVKITDDYEIVNTNGGLNATVRKKGKANGETTGTFKCSCKATPATSCPVDFTDDIIACLGDPCCKLLVTIKTGSLSAQLSAGDNSNQSGFGKPDIWNAVIYPKK